MSTRNNVLAAGALLLAACGGGNAGDVAPLGSAEGAVREFFAAVSDSNIARMGRAWGTSKGPAAVRNDPADWEERMKVVQVYLRRGTFRVTSNVVDPTASNKRNLLVELTRGSCVKVLPFVAVRTSSGGWLVESMDLNQAGNPINPCPTPRGNP